MGLLRRRKHFAHRAHYPLRLTQECVDAALHIAAMFKSLGTGKLDYVGVTRLVQEQMAKPAALAV